MPRRDPDTTAADLGAAADSFRAACFDTHQAIRRAQNLAAGGAVRRWRRSRAELVHSAYADLVDAQLRLNALVATIESVLPPAGKAATP